jgi:hypothetical protein
MSRIRRTTQVSTVAALVLVLSSAAGTALAVADGASGASAPRASTDPAASPDSWFPGADGLSATADVAVSPASWFTGMVDSGVVASVAVAPASWFPGMVGTVGTDTEALSPASWFPGAPTDVVGAPTAVSV